MLAVLAVRAKAMTPGFWSLVAAALGAGAMIVVKPYLIVGFIPAVVGAAYAARSWRVLVALENWIVLATVAVYGAVVVMVFPEFITETVPLVSAVYLPLRNPWTIMVSEFAAVPIWLAACFAIVWLRRKKIAGWHYGLLLVASAGFMVAFIVQGKGWAYHAYPILALVLIALAFAVSEHKPPASAPDGWSPAWSDLGIRGVLRAHLLLDEYPRHRQHERPCGSDPAGQASSHDAGDLE